MMDNVAKLGDTSLAGSTSQLHGLPPQSKTYHSKEGVDL